MFSHLVMSLIIFARLRGNRVLAEGTESSRSWISDWTECCLGEKENPTDCLEKRTMRDLAGFNEILKRDLGLTEENGYLRLGKAIEEGEDKELQFLQSENLKAKKAIEEKTEKSRGLIDEIGDFIVYVATKIFSPFTGVTEESSDDDVNYHQKQVIEERGHKKKELKKKVKQLKLILLLMVFKNKIKMFISKLQFLVQLKFLGVATINMLTNVVRLWLELKKKHKPNKVVFYENAHHQHHYDNEHIDHEPSFGHPIHSHFAQHEEEDYGGGPWPWSRSYAEKTNDQTFKQMPPRRYKTNNGYVTYYN